MSQVINKSSSFLLVLALLSVLALPCINACPTCAPTHKPPPPPPAPKPTTPCPPPPAAPAAARCPRDALKLGVCADVLGLVHAVVGGLGAPSSESKCCALLNGLTDLEAAVCLCTAIKANVLGIKLDIPVALSVLLNACQKDVPSKFTCK